jgi:hypothetical protein
VGRSSGRRRPVLALCPPVDMASRAFRLARSLCACIKMERFHAHDMICHMIELLLRPLLGKRQKARQHRKNNRRRRRALGSLTAVGVGRAAPRDPGAPPGVPESRGAGCPRGVRPPRPRREITPINVRVVLTRPISGAVLLPRPWSPGRAERIPVTVVDSALL